MVRLTMKPSLRLLWHKAHADLLLVAAAAIYLSACLHCNGRNAVVTSASRLPAELESQGDKLFGRVQALEGQLSLVLAPPEETLLRESIHVHRMARVELNLLRRLFPSNTNSHLHCRWATAVAESGDGDALSSLSEEETGHLWRLLWTAEKVLNDEMRVAQAAAKRQIQEEVLSVTPCPKFSPCTVQRPGPLPPGFEDEHPLVFQIANNMAEAEPGSIAVCASPLGRDKARVRLLDAPKNCPKLPGHEVLKEWDDPQVDPRVGFDPACSHSKDFLQIYPTGFDVVRLRGVYVNGQALVFNRSALFLRQGCQDGLQGGELLRYQAMSRNVTHVRTAFNLAYRQFKNFFHGLIEGLAAVLEMAPFVSRDPNLPVLGFRTQFEELERLLGPIIGASPTSLRRYEMKPGSLESGGLFSVGTLYQPMYPICGMPSTQLWHHLRSNYLLQEDGLPILHPTWAFRRPNAAPLTDEEMSAYPEDWVVVVARRHGNKRVLRQMPQVVQLLEELFGRERVVTFWGDLPILEARNLFRRARLFVAVHGAALSNLIFMPMNSHSLEIRPRVRSVSCYHALAESCGIHYNLVLGGDEDPSKRDEDIFDTEIKKVEQVIRSVAKQMLLL